MPLDLSSGRVALWNLEEASGDFADSSGNGNTLSRVGTVNRVDGDDNYGQHFPPGLNGGAVIPCTGDIDLAGDFTLAWSLAFYGVPGVPYNYQFLSGSDGLQDGAMDSESFFIISNELQYAFDKTLAGGTPMSQGTWYRFLLRVPAGGQPQFFLNAISKALLSTNDYGGSGQYDLAFYPTFNVGGGYLDRVCLWNRLLTAYEITADFTN